ncbi:MAG: hypothetical protein APR63_05025 [Desulfuromonas sp. SDB]|nr:MAG: hypothetical protein APR63_05025 [Desulfuromonas sp. SDB]
MPKPLLIIIYGPPCTGKTTIAGKISQKFNLPFINKDQIKEILFDTLGTEDRQWSKKLGYSSIMILFNLIESLISKNVSLIVEDVFKHQADRQRFQELKKKYNYFPVEIRCKTEGEVLVRRFKQRSLSGKRHPGHVDHSNYEEFRENLLIGKNDFLNLGGLILDIDTTDFDKIDYDSIFNSIKSVF